MLKIKVSELGNQTEIYHSRMANKWKLWEKLRHGELLWKVQYLWNNLEEWSM